MHTLRAAIEAFGSAATKRSLPETIAVAIDRVIYIEARDYGVGNLID